MSIPKNPSDIFEEFTHDYKAIYADDLQAVILYGSAAKGQYRYKKSDINFLIVLSETGINNLSKCTPLIKKWRKRNVATPLILSQSYIASSLDSFAIEFTDLQAYYEVVYGEDVLMPLKIDPKDLRLQCERELKGKLLHLRKSFLTVATNRRLLKLLVQQSLSDFSVLFASLLRLERIAVPPEKASTVIQTAEHFKLNVSVFQQLQDIAESKRKPSPSEWPGIMEGYIAEIRTLALLVDKMGS